jgi:hypothetical protein
VGQDGLLFFSGRTTRLIGEQFAGPFFIIARGWVRSMREVGEAEFCGKAIGIDAQKSLPRPAQKTIMLQLEVLLLDGVAVDADRVCCVAARAEHPAIVRPVLLEPAAQLDPYQSRFG